MAATATLASFGGTFITGGQAGRPGCFIPNNEDTEFEERLLNANDTLHSMLSFDEMAAWDAVDYNESCDDEDERSLAERLLKTEPTPDRIRAAAMVAIENPELLVDLYYMAARPEDIHDRNDQRVVRKKMFRLIRNVAAAMLTLKSEKEIVRALAMRRDEKSGKTLLACLAEFARIEIKRKLRHFTALTVLQMLGYSDVYARALD